MAVLCALLTPSAPHTVLAHVLLASSTLGVEALADLAYSRAAPHGEAVRVLGTARLVLPLDDAPIRVLCAPSRGGLFPAAKFADICHVLTCAYSGRAVVLDADLTGPIDE